MTRIVRFALALAIVGGWLWVTSGEQAGAESYVPISGAGSTWSQNALNQWVADVSQFGMQVNYAGTGSSDGRNQFLAGTVDFAASDIPFQSHPTDGSNPETPEPGSYAYIPVTAGGTSFMYHLTINGHRVTNLRLSGQNVTKIFTGVITQWNDPAIVADNPQLSLPNETIIPVVRSDGSGSTAQFSLWMITQYNTLWTSYCGKTGRSGVCGETSLYPTVGNMIAQNGDLGVAGYVASPSYGEGAIGYVEYSYALQQKFPVAKVLNSAGYYTEPTPDNVAVSLLRAEVDTTDTDPSLYLTQKLDGVYNDTDPRTYPLSSYSYLILPTKVKGQFTASKGKTLAAYSYYAMCQGQTESASLGYSPMPFNLVRDTFDQIKKIPGQAVPSFDLNQCHNPTIDPNNASDPNLLAKVAPQPQGCDKQGPTQCATGTAGDTAPTPLNGGGGGGGANGSSGSGGGGSPTGSTGSGGGGSATGSSGTGGRSGTSGARGGRSSSASGTGSAPSAARGATVVTPAGAANATGSGTGGGASAGTSSQGATAPAACDPSSGTCGGNAQQVAAASDPSAQGVPTASPVTVAAASGWTGTQTLVLLIGLLVVVLVLAPGVAARAFARRDEER